MRLRQLRVLSKKILQESTEYTLTNEVDSKLKEHMKIVDKRT